jgi:hypothetical protein
MKLLGIANTKTMKGEAFGYRTYIMHLAPSTLSGYQVCASASPGCTEACLNLSGMGRFSNVQAARITKTRWFFEDRGAFMAQLVKEIASAIRSANKAGLKAVFRLNGTSDIRWETIPVAGFSNVMAMFPQAQFYDYTKHMNRRNVPVNYHLTFSRSEVNEMEALSIISMGTNVAVVFDELPMTWHGWKVVDGTETDLRFLDESRVVVGLKANGKAKKDDTGFTVLTRASVTPRYRKMA